MVLVDTSVWIDYLRRGNPILVRLLEEGDLLLHPMVRGELALGSIKKRSEFLSMLDHLPCAEVAEDKEVFLFIEQEKLYSRGIGWVDASLMVSARLSSADFYTLDKKLKRQWDRL